MSLKLILTRLLDRSIHPAHQPYSPAPPSHQTSSQNQTPNDMPPSEASYIEIETNQQTIGDIKFGTEKAIIVDARGQARDMTRQNSHVVGGGKLVSRIEDIGGVCKFCQTIAMEQFQTGDINLQQAQILSLYDKGSATVCNVCGTQGCILHIRPIQTEQGVLSICIDCEQKLKKQLRKQKLIRFLLAPFTESEEYRL